MYFFVYNDHLGSCGRPEVAQSRVISGINARRGSWPWQILMLQNGAPMCGGSIISPLWIVTAAHCVSGRESNARLFKVRYVSLEPCITSYLNVPTLSRFRVLSAAVHYAKILFQTELSFSF